MREAGINNRANGLHDKFPVRCLLCAQICRSFQQFFFLLFSEWPYHPLFCFESVLRVYTKVASELDETFGGKCAACFVSGMITPYPQRHPIARICESQFAIRFSFTLRLRSGRFAPAHAHALPPRRFVPPGEFQSA